ncbi:MAG: polysaccharide pyruvyl transferase family protein [Holophagaceae bacterium]|nr:polysaccharide pyruvyl transferase family protein [Holophagaceae bacterium]
MMGRAHVLVASIELVHSPYGVLPNLMNNVAMQARPNSNRDATRTLGLVGWYWRGNFGDELMALQYALRLRASGFKVLGWQISKSTAARYCIEIVEHVDELINRSDALIYGGGGLFTNAHRHMEHSNNFSGAMLHLAKLVKLTGKPLILSSVGGDGDSTLLSETQSTLIRAASLITIRNAEDSPWLDRFGVPYEVYPDIIWRAPIDLDLKPASALDTLIKHQCGRVEEWMLRSLRKGLEWTGAPIRYVPFYSERPIMAHHDKEGFYHHQIEESLALIQRTKLVITNRLHLGMTVLAMGGSTLLVRPEPKARMVFERLGMSRFIVEQRMGLLGKGSSILSVLRDKSEPQLSVHQRNHLAMEADNHIVSIINFLNSRSDSSRNISKLID